MQILQNFALLFYVLQLIWKLSDPSNYLKVLFELLRIIESLLNESFQQIEEKFFEFTCFLYGFGIGSAVESWVLKNGSTKISRIARKVDRRNHASMLSRDFWSLYFLNFSYFGSITKTTHRLPHRLRLRKGSNCLIWKLWSFSKDFWSILKTYREIKTLENLKVGKLDKVISCISKSWLFYQQQ